MANVAPDPGPVRPSAAARDYVLAHLGRDGEVGNEVAVDVPDLTLPVAEGHGAEPARLRGHPCPGQDLALDYRYLVHLPSSFLGGVRLRPWAPYPERGQQADEQPHHEQQEGVGEWGRVEHVQGVQSPGPCLPAGREEGTDNRRPGPAAEEEEAVEDAKAHPGLLLSQRGRGRVHVRGVGEGETRSDAEHTDRHEVWGGPGREGRDKQDGEQHDREAGVDRGLEADAVREAPGHGREEREGYRPWREHEPR